MVGIVRCVVMKMVMLCKKLPKSDLSVFVKVSGNRWVAEIKEDGDRIRMTVESGVVRLTNRSGKDVTEKYPEFKGKIDIEDCFIDGEMCVLDDRGVSQFNTGISFRTHCKDANTIRTASEKYPVTYVVFDILELKGVDLRFTPFKDRRDILKAIAFDHRNIQIVKQSKDVMGLWKEITELGGEGIILKDVNSLYHEGKRAQCWKKVKDIKEIDLPAEYLKKPELTTQPTKLMTLEDAEEEHILNVMKYVSNSVQSAAPILGVSERTLQRRLKIIREKNPPE